jgi:hypothetical protein
VTAERREEKGRGERERREGEKMGKPTPSKPPTPPPPLTPERQQDAPTAPHPCQQWRRCRLVSNRCAPVPMPPPQPAPHSNQRRRRHLCRRAIPAPTPTPVPVPAHTYTYTTIPSPTPAPPLTNSIGAQTPNRARAQVTSEQLVCISVRQCKINFALFPPVYGMQLHIIFSFFEGGRV